MKVIKIRKSNFPEGDPGFSQAILCHDGKFVVSYLGGPLTVFGEPPKTGSPSGLPGSGTLDLEDFARSPMIQRYYEAFMTPYPEDLEAQKAWLLSFACKYFDLNSDDIKKVRQLGLGG